MRSVVDTVPSGEKRAVAEIDVVNAVVMFGMRYGGS